MPQGIDAIGKARFRRKQAKDVRAALAGAEDKKGQDEDKLTKETLGVMFSVALLADGASALVAFLDVIPGLGTTLNFILYVWMALTFWLWFAIKGHGWAAATGLLFGTGFEIIPIMAAVPTFIALVIGLYARSKGINPLHLKKSLKSVRRLATHKS